MPRTDVSVNIVPLTLHGSAEQRLSARSEHVEESSAARLWCDVARLAGLSHQTVSRVLNNQPGVMPETRERVLAAIDELGYRRNGFARALVTSRTRLLGVVVYGTSWYGPAGTLHGIQQAARDARYFVTVVDLDKMTHGT